MELQPETESKEVKANQVAGAAREQSANLRTLAKVSPGARDSCGWVSGAAGVCRGLYQEGHKQTPSGSIMRV